ncbi:MAG: arylsulfatase [Verrucomicrobia bacterium]|nr:arylsulfatase [Verrucomicrobiota bacterium]
MKLPLTFLRLLLCAGLAFALRASAEAAQARKPNIIFILADDLGVGHVGAYGQQKIKTPNIDALAAEGMKFTRFYSGANVCAPARSTLMTGLHTGHTAVRNNGLDRHLYDADVTVAEVLKQAGYATGGFGKWGLGRLGTPGVAVQQGFDEWFGQYSQVHAHFYYPFFLMNNREQFPLPMNEGRKRVRYAQDEIHDHAMTFITTQAQARRPFFAYLPYILPHVELTCPEDSWEMYKGRWPKVVRPDPRPGYIGSQDANPEFAGMVTRLDRQVGQIMALLKKLDIDDNTIVFFTSDNGPQPGAWKDIFVEFFDGAAGLRGAKTNFYEGGIREPMIVRWPGRIRPGSTSDHLGYFPDVMPTLAELAGATARLPKTDGISIVPTLLGQKGQQQHEFLYWEAASANQTIIQHAVRWGDWKAIKDGPKAKWELFNLKTDEKETTDVIDRHPDVMKRIAFIIEQEHTPERKYEAAPREGAVDYVR